MRMVAGGHARRCPLGDALNSYATTDALGRRAAAIAKNARLLERDPAGLDLYEAGTERIWMPRGSLNEIAYDLAEQESAIYDYRGLAARPGDIVLDAGANVGLYTRQALKQRASKVIAIEPAPPNLECLRRSFRDEISAGRVIVYPRGVWDKEDTLEMHLNPENAAAHSFVTWSARATLMTLPVTTVGRIVKELSLDQVDFIKMDIEGAERRALAGSSETIRRYRPRIAVCVYHLDDDAVVIPAAVRAARGDYREAVCSCVWLGNEVRPKVCFYY
jgi:FkbM family methyltransferase